ncbi:uncharacterized protein LOC143859942 [Tasmannia lanceolata]|uniref:uncharacterized protein LOC143859942 n=1 Tax=Tasmannia lanceolata TaxID=3420 RepID=UPI004063B773
MREVQHSDPMADGSAHVTYDGTDRGRGSGRGRGRGSSRDSGGRGRRSRYCTHCRMERHTVDYCYDLHPELRPYKPASASAVASDSPSSSTAPSMTPHTMVIPVQNMMICYISGKKGSNQLPRLHIKDMKIGP